MNTRNKGNRWLLLCALLFALFTADLLLGKASIAFGFTPPLRAGDLGEFLLLLAIATCFVIGALRRESATTNGQP